MPYDWRKPNRLLTLQFGDIANEQGVFPACCAFASFISVENAGALVTMGEIGRDKEVHEIVFPNFDMEYTEACVIEGEGVGLFARKKEERSK